MPMLTAIQEARSIRYPNSRNSSISGLASSPDQYPAGFGAAPLRPASIMSQDDPATIGAGIHRPLSPRGGLPMRKREEVELAIERPQMRQVPKAQSPIPLPPSPPVGEGSTSEGTKNT